METSETCLWNETNKFIERWKSQGYSVLDDALSSHEEFRFREITMYKNGLFLVFMASCREGGCHESSNFVLLTEHYLQRLCGMARNLHEAERQTRSLS